MRKVIVIALVSVLLLLFTGSAMAELNFAAKSFYAQGVLALPSGNFGDFAGTGIGAGVGMSVPFNEQFDFRGEISYISYGGQTFNEVDTSVSMLPVAVLAQYRVKPTDPFFFLGGLGLTRTKVSSDATVSGFGSFSADATSTDLTLTLGAGYEINEQFSLEGRLNLISDSNYLSLHVAYGF